MKWIRLGDLMAVRAGSVEPSRFPDELFKLYSIPAYDAGVPEAKLGSEIGSSKQTVLPGDVLLSRIVPHIRRAWVVGPHDRIRIIASGEWIVFRSNQVYAPYLRHVLLGDRFHGEFMQTVAGVGGSLLRARSKQVATIQIPLPALAEQKRIGSILDAAETLRTKRLRAVSSLEQLRLAFFEERFGDPVRNPKHWPVRALGSQIVEMFYGPRFYNEAYSAEGVRIIRITDLGLDGTLSFENMPRMIVSAADQARYQLRIGDLIFARSGATVGKVAIVEDGAPPCIAGAYFIVMRFSDQILPAFAAAMLRHPSIQGIVQSRSRQSAQQNFSGPGLRDLTMILPPIELQKAYVESLASLSRIGSAMRQSDERIVNLVSSLQLRAFRGEL
jgi:type I restriction enzyme, S subunit